MRYFAAIVALLGIAAAKNPDGQIIFPPCFANNMIVQRGSVQNGNSPFIWGWADNAHEVYIQIGGGKEIKADHWHGAKAGPGMFAWCVSYQKLGRATVLPDGPFDIAFSTGKGSKRGEWQRFTNVVAGDVWLVVDPINPEHRLPSKPSGQVGTGANDIRLLQLWTTDWSRVNERTNAFAIGTWQFMGEPSASLPEDCPVATYWLESLRGMTNKLPYPLGVLLVSRVRGPFGESIINGHGSREFPQSLQSDPSFQLNYAWTNAWERARSELSAATRDYVAGKAPAKRRGNVLPKPTFETLPLGTPAIDNVEKENLLYVTRGILH
jgi:hypothetical protein